MNPTGKEEIQHSDVGNLKRALQDSRIEAKVGELNDRSKTLLIAFSRTGLNDLTKLLKATNDTSKKLSELSTWFDS